MKTHQEKEYSCKICCSTFSDYLNLKQHLQTHTGEKAFSCEVCGSVYSDSSALKIHMRILTGEKPFVCEVCGSAFSKNSNGKKLSENTKIWMQKRCTFHIFCTRTVSLVKLFEYHGDS